jgi:glycosyltransferase involved in cell wall biosynthesis
MRDPLRIAWAPFAHPDAPQGYGVIGRELATYLAEAGAVMVPHTSFDFDIAVLVTIPTAWPFPKQQLRRDVVFHTMYDMQHLPEGWVDILNCCGAVWVPSEFCATQFKNDGVTRPIVKAGYGVDKRMFYPRTVEREPGPMRFCAWGHALASRKNILRTIRAFMEADLPPDEAVLEVKLAAGASQPTVVDADHKDVPNIRVFAEDWDRYRLAKWLRSNDMFVYLPGGEGFGLQPLEAMACGVPVICAANTGMLEYLRPDVAFMVRTVGVEENFAYSTRFGDGQMQFVPDFAQARDYIRWAFEHRSDVATMGARAALYARGEWSWQQAGQRALVALEEAYVQCSQ